MTRRNDRRYRDDIDLGLDDFDSGMGYYNDRGPRRAPRRPPKRSGGGGDSSMTLIVIILIIAGLGYGYYNGWFDEFLYGDPSSAQAKKQTVEINEFGTLRVSSTPDEASIYIDNRLMGQTPYDAEKLKVGQYQIKLEKSGYQPYTAQVNVEANKINRYKVVMDEISYGLTVSTSPKNAKVRILNSDKEYTPQVKLKPGKYKLRISAPGYISKIQDVVVFDGAQAIFVDLKPNNKRYPLEVVINPAQARPISRVEILESADEYKNGIKLRSGEYTLEVKAPGYEVFRKKVEISGAPASILVDLKGQPVNFSLNVNPANADIKFVGLDKTYKSGMQIMPGQYRLQFSANGYRTETKTLAITNSEPQNIQLKPALFSININTDPVLSQIKIVSPANLEYGENKTYKPGRYTVEISSEGYKTFTKTIDIKNEDVSFDVKLKKNVFPLTIKTEPSNARVQILNIREKYKDGIMLAPGSYKIRVSAKNYRTKNVHYVIKDAGLTRTIKLQEDRYTIAVKTQPENATVRIVQPAMQYSATKKYNPGTYQLEISAPGYKPETRMVALKRKNVSLDVKLGEEVYKLTVKTTPENARVSILDYPEEYVPGIKLIPGRYELEVSAEGYAPVKQWVTITDKDENVFILLKEKLMTLKVETDPPGAHISIIEHPSEYKDGVQLPSGIYTVQVSKKDFETNEQQITVGKQDILLKVKLKYKRQLSTDHAFEPDMVVVPAGSFKLGSPSSERGRRGNEGPQRLIRFSKPFAISKTEITFEQYDRFAQETGRQRPSDNGWGRRSRPVINVSWRDAEAYTKWLSERTGKRYKLPSEAQWEYAAKAGTNTPFNTGSCISPKQANYDGDYSYRDCAKGVNRGKTVRTGSFKANRFGLHDMHGNVWEWTDDCWNSSHKRAPADGGVRERGSCGDRVIKGGGWDSIPKDVRSSVRRAESVKEQSKNLGFRVIRVLD